MTQRPDAWRQEVETRGGRNDADTAVTNKSTDEENQKRRPRRTNE